MTKRTKESSLTGLLFNVASKRTKTGINSPTRVLTLKLSITITDVVSLGGAGLLEKYNQSFKTALEMIYPGKNTNMRSNLKREKMAPVFVSQNTIQLLG